MNNNQLFSLSSTESSVFDTYLIYVILGLFLLIAIIGLFVLATTSCCCFFCYFYSSLCCFRGCRHSSYKLNKITEKDPDPNNRNTTKINFIKRRSSDITDFANLYDTCPYLINSRTMLTGKVEKPQNSDTNCTLISPRSLCSSFRSRDETVATIQNDLSKSPGKIIRTDNDKINSLSLSAKSNKSITCSQPFAYIKQTNDRLQILRRCPSHDHKNSSSIVSIDVTRISLSDSDNNRPTNSPTTNIYETVLPSFNQVPSSNRSTPIYDTDWSSKAKPIQVHKKPANEYNHISVIDIPIPNVSSVLTTDYFQQQYPYDTFFANRTKTSDSMRRANMLRRLKDDAAFLY